MNWNIQDIAETYPFVLDSINSTNIDIAKGIYDIRIVLHVDGYNKDLMHPSVGSDSFRATLIKQQYDKVLVSVFCPVAFMCYNEVQIELPILEIGTQPSLDVESYVIMSPGAIPNYIESAGLRIHEDCFVFVQDSPTLTWGRTELSKLAFEDSEFASVSYKNGKVVFNGDFSNGIPIKRMRPIELNYSSKGLRSINGMTDTVNFATSSEVDAKVEQNDVLNTTVLTIKPVLQANQ